MEMRRAKPARMNCLHREDYLPSMTGIAVAVYEGDVAADPARTARANAEHRAHIGHQTAGAERLAGTYPFTLERSVAHYRINAYLHQLIEPEFRTRFLAYPVTTSDEAGLTPEERDLVARRDWRGMIRYGVIFFLLEKLGAVVGVSNLHIYAAMRGETLEDFQKTRNAQVLYSVAGKGSTGMS
jgi:gallate dioxygenase